MPAARGSALKLFIAKGIQDSILKRLGRELERAAPPELGVRSANTTAISATKTGVRVTLENGKVHYFTVSVVEEWQTTPN